MIYEHRTYHVTPGRMHDLLHRFEHVTLPIWSRLGIRQAGFWTVVVGNSSNDLLYMLAWDSLAERERKWAAFQVDPEWIEKRDKSEENGPLVNSITSAFLQPTPFSAVK